MLALRFFDGVTLQRVQIKTDARNGSFQLVSYSIQKRVLALVAADLANQKDSVEHDSCDKDCEEKHAKHIEGDAAAVDVYPRDVQRYSQCREANAKRDEEGNGSAAACQVHPC